VRVAGARAGEEDSMQEHRLDELARVLASGVSRRQMLKGLAAVAVVSWPAPFARSLVARGAGALGTPAAQAQSCARQQYDNCAANMVVDATCDSCRGFGGGINVDVQFSASMNTICGCAGDNDLTISVTNAFRDPGPAVPGAIVPPAANSNHHAGHAIDFNLLYTDASGTQQTCGSGCLGGAGRPQSVTDFIQCVKDAGLRWGGDFNTPDPIHIDDGLNVENRTEWEQRVNALASSADCPLGQTCNTDSGQCEVLAGVCPTPPLDWQPADGTALAAGPLFGARKLQALPCCCTPCERCDEASGQCFPFDLNGL
jgi:hypothetical protein